MVTVGEQRLMTMLEKFCREQNRNNSFVELNTNGVKTTKGIKILIRISDISEVIFFGTNDVQLNLLSGNKIIKISEVEYKTKIEKYINVL